MPRVGVHEKVAADQIKAGAKEASILGKLYLDLRDTGITRLALAGATVPEIHAISGHSMKTIHDVLRHYLAIDDRLADAAIAKAQDLDGAGGHRDLTNNATNQRECAINR